MFLLIDKPKGITSHDVIDKVRGLTGEKKVGHAGTLDPMATGLLIVAISRSSTKLLGSLTKDTTKTYLAEINLGEERDTHDLEGKVVRQKDNFSKPDKVLIESLLKKFKGEIMQAPPKYSAIKVGGQKAYELARKGKKVKLSERQVVIHDIRLVSYNYPILKIKTEVSAGTYIRALARDIGREIGSYAYLRNLRRTKIGKYSVKEAVKLKDLTNNNWKDYLKELGI
jgi:tRNA pseudouridine55 synthase